ncbi:MAG: reverse transcriptase family protein, partial [Pseudomonadota bacterium]
SVLVIALYLPFWNNKNIHDDAIQCVTEVIDYCLTALLDPQRARIVVCGDFNDLRLYSDEISRVTNLTQIVNFPTRVNNTLDLIFTNFSQSHPPSCLAPIGKSDHVCVFWCPSRNCSKVVKQRVRKFSKSSIISFHNFVDNVDWLSYVHDISNLDFAFSTLLCTLRYIFDMFFPLKTVRMRPDDKPWVRPSLKLLINARDRAFFKQQSSKYRRLRREVIAHIKDLKEQYFAQIARTKDPRKMWKSVRSFSGQASFSSPLPSPEQFSDYFSSVFQHEQPVNEFPDILGSNVSDVFSVSEVFSLLSSLKRKSCGPDGLPYWVFRNSASSFSPVLTFLFNRSVCEAYVPLCLKKAYVTPVPKVPRAANVSDFRPISLLPIVSKVFEKLVSKHFILPCIRDRLTSQFAYIPGPGSGTCCSLTYIYDRMLKFLDTSGAVRVLSIDFSKAFDKILHSSIVTSAQKFCLPPNIINWIKSFLSNRFQCVRVKGVFSSWSLIRSGVPQGSVLGPILFCMVVDSLSSVSPNSLCVKYADDITILHFVRCVSDDHLQSELDNVCDWSRVNKLCLNESKS